MHIAKNLRKFQTVRSNIALVFLICSLAFGIEGARANDPGQLWLGYTPGSTTGAPISPYVAELSDLYHSRDFDALERLASRPPPSSEQRVTAQAYLGLALEGGGRTEAAVMQLAQIQSELTTLIGSENERKARGESIPEWESVNSRIGTDAEALLLTVERALERSLVRLGRDAEARVLAQKVWQSSRKMATAFRQEPGVGECTVRQTIGSQRAIACRKIDRKVQDIVLGADGQLQNAMAKTQTIDTQLFYDLKSIDGQLEEINRSTTEFLADRKIADAIVIVDKPSIQEPLSAVKILFGTNRAVSQVSLAPNTSRVSFDKPGTQLSLGEAVVTIPRNDKGAVPSRQQLFGWEIIRGASDPDKHFIIGGVEKSDRAKFMSSLREINVKSEYFKNSAFIFIHGYYNSFDDTILAAAQLTHNMGFDGVPFVFSWPSYGDAIYYNADRQQAEASQFPFAEFVRLVLESNDIRRVHFIAHSMGAQVLLRGLPRVLTNLPPKLRAKIGEAMLAAPDVDHTNFSGHVSDIKNHKVPITIYASKADWAMQVSRMWNDLSVPRVGDVPPTGPVILSGVYTIDVSNIDLGAHSIFVASRIILADMGKLIQAGLHPPKVRWPQLYEMPKGVKPPQYWMFR